MAMKKRVLGGVALTASLALAVSACSSSTTSGGSGDGGDSGVFTVGTTDKVTVLDPAGSYDNGSFHVMKQVFPFLMEYVPGTADVEPSLAETAEFTAPDEFTVTLPEGLKWANGNDLTSSDVKFSFERQLNIRDANGPSSLLGAIEEIDTPDDTTVVFKLNQENDQTFPQILTGPAGPIVDEEVFSADELTPDDEIVDGDAFAGPYRITTYNFNELIEYQAYEDYQGLTEGAQTETIQTKYYSDQNNMKLDIENGTIDVAYRSLSATDYEDLEKSDKVTVHKGPGGEIRYIVFNLDTMPFGERSDNPDPDKALAVRQAMADLIDRDALAENVFKETYTPLYSFVPEGLPGAIEPLSEEYGDGKGGPDAERAAKRLEDAGIETPLDIQLQYNPDHYGSSSGDEYALVKNQLEASDLFNVDLQSTEWVQYAKDRSDDVYPMYQLGWFPDYSDADNYLVPFFYNTEDEPSFLANHYTNEDVNKALRDQVAISDEDERAATIEDLQTTLAEDLPTLPLLQGSQVAVAGNDVQGVEDTLDAGFVFRLYMLSKDN